MRHYALTWLLALFETLCACGGSSSDGVDGGSADSTPEDLADAYVEPNDFVESYAPVSPPAVRMNQGLSVVFVPSSQGGDIISSDTVTGEVDDVAVRFFPYAERLNREFHFVPFPVWTPGSEITVRIFEGVTYQNSGDSMEGDFGWTFRVEDAPLRETYEAGVTAPLTTSELEMAAAGGATFQWENVVGDWQNPDSTLYVVSEPVDPNDADIQALGDKMTASLDGLSAIGLAAPQIGINRRLFSAELSGRPAATFINPIILDWSRDEWYYWVGGEGCLSIEGVSARVARPRWIKVSYYTSDGSFVDEDYLETRAATTFLHEYDHINGILMTDRQEEKGFN